MSIEVIVIGNEQLSIECMKYLMVNNINIIAIISNSSEVVNWCKQKNIASIDLEQLQKSQYRNMLIFSIINYDKIPEEIFKHNLVINFHNSFLPRYAGLNSTSWALINQEKTHGITWHKVTNTIDAGEITFQSEIVIENNETALSLNLKCIEHALLGFKQVIQSILQNSLEYKEQDLSLRTYFSASKIILNYGFINPNGATNDIEILSRAIDFGDRSLNRLGTLKVLCNNQIFILGDVSRDSNNQCKISLNSGLLYSNLVLDLYGNQSKITELANIINPSFSQEELTFLGQIQAQEYINYKKLQKLTENNERLFIEHPNSLLNDQLIIPLNHSINTETFIAIAKLVLSHFYLEDNLTTVYLPKLNNSSTLIDSLVDNLAIVNVKKSELAVTWDKLIKIVANEISAPILVSKDFNYRYKLDRCSEIALVLGCDMIIDPNYKLVIRLDDNSIIFAFNKENTELSSSIYLIFKEALSAIEYVDLESTVGNINILPSNLRAKLENLFPLQLFPNNQLIFSEFEKNAKLNPDKLALVYENTYYSYQKLNEEANQLAHYLREHYNLQPGAIVALYLDKCPQLIVAILATLKAGGAYLPLDINHALDRTQFIVADAKPNLILSTTNIVSQLDWERYSSQTKVINLDDDNICLIIKKMSKQNLDLAINHNQLAYIIYTSGTTGNPKGVLQLHTNLTRLFTATKDLFSFSSQDVWVLFHSHIFDFSVWEMWGALYYGGSLIIPNSEQNTDFNLFYKLCSHHKVTVLNQTPKAFYEFINIAQIYFEQNPNYRLFSLRYIIFGGDKLVPSKLKTWIELYPIDNPKLINMYGITETTVHVTFKQLSMQDIDKNNSNIGIPIPDMQLYILDPNLNPVPQGVVGELYVGGAGLANGYLNQQQLTITRFLPNPFKLSQNVINMGYTRIYKTGDLAKLNFNNEIEYIGRNDTQVKIRGYRIELGEIESLLMQMHGIDNAVVILRNKNGEDYLVAYYVASEDITAQNIRSFLLNKTPQYMIPTFMVKLPKIPLTINGKLDLSALPEADTPYHQAESYMQPINPNEIVVCKAFANTLAKETVGITDDFFRLGGNSISVIKLVTLLKKSGFNVSVANVYKHKTPQNLCLYSVNSIANIDALKYIPFSLISDNDLSHKVGITDAYPASTLQIGMIFESIINKDGTYHDVFSYLIYKHFDFNKFSQVIDSLFTKFSGLRTGFVSNDKYAYLCIEHQKVDVSKKIRIAKQSSLEEVIAEEINNNFELSSPGLIRFIIIPNSNYFTLILSFHHVIADGLSIALLLSEIIQAYTQSDNPTLLLTEKISYGKYVAKEQLTIANTAHLDFWKTYLANYTFLNLSFISENQKLSQNQQIENFNELNLDYSTQIIKYCKDNHCTPDNFFMALFTLIIAKFSNTNDVLIGLVVNNRLEEEYGDQLFGCFLNTIPLRLSVNTRLNKDLINLIDSIDDEKALIFSHKEYPQAEIKSNVLSKELRLFNFAFNYIHFETLDKYYSTGILENRILFEKNSIPLTLHIVLRDNKFVINFKADHEFMSSNILQLFSDHFIYYLEQVIINNPTTGTFQELPSTVTTANLTNLEEYQFPKISTLWEEFYCSANHCRDKIAIVSPKGSISYAKLLQDSLNIGKYLQENHQNEELVAIWCEKSYLQIPTVLGILASNKAYLPFNNLWPVDMIKEVLEFSKVSTVLISQQNFNNYSDLFKFLPFKLVIIEEVVHDAELNKVSLNKFNYNPDSLAYVIFTSGSTGTPKGVAITNRQALNTIFAVKQKFFINSNDSIFAISELSFDLSVFDIFGALLSGAKLIIPSYEKIHDINDWGYWVAKYKVTIWNSVPQLFYLLIQNLNLDILASLRLILLSGDTISQKIVDKASQTVPFAKLISLGGATEGSIWSIWHEVNYSEQRNKQYVPYGKAMPNQKIYILNKDLSFTPTNLIGEIYIGGQGVALGYWQDKVLTSQRFIEHPQLGKIYRTGDLGIMHIDGVIEIKGRIDNQVKVNGYRVELGEIEYHLAQLPNIRQSCVISQQSAESRQNELIAYICYDNLQQPLDIIQLKNLLANKLPQYILPQHFIQLDSLPITANGKIDRKALPKLEVQHANKYLAPNNRIEQLLQNICGELLNLDVITISMLDNFFSLGGDSILAIQLAAKLSKHDLNITIKEIYESNNLLKIAQIINDKTGQIKEQKIEESKSLPSKFDLLPIQKWFFRQHELENINNPNYWNQSFLIKTPLLDKEKLEVAINELFKRHNQLSVHFEQSTSSWQQIKSTNKNLQIKEINANGLTNTELIDTLSNLQSGFKITDPNKPLWCATYITGYPDNSARIFLAFHHLIIDAVSWRIIIDELLDLYEKRALLPKVFAVYQEWVNYINQYAMNFPRETDYWRKLTIESESPAKLAIYPDCSLVEKIILEAPQVESLHQINQVYNTRINDILLTTLGYVLADINQCPSNWVTLEGHGREMLSSDLEISRAIGWFTTLYPVKLSIFKEISTSIKETKEYLRTIPHNGIGYGAINENYTKLPKISFNYLGQFNNSNSDMWQLVDENSGVNFDPLNQEIYDLNINCYIINNRFVFKVLTKYAHEIAQTVIDKFGDYLEQIIRHGQNCINKNIYEPTVSDYNFQLNPSHLNRLYERYPAKQIQQITLANSLQQGIIYSYLTNQKDDSYIIQATYKYTGELDVTKYKQAWELLACKYPSLRSSFDWEEDYIIQIFHTQGQVNFNYIDKSQCKISNSELNAMISKDRQRNFKLNEPNLFRVHLLRDNSNYYLIFTIHHIITDGWSNSILLNQLHTYYAQLLNDEKVEIIQDLAPIKLYNYTKAEISSTQFWQSEFNHEVNPNSWLEKLGANQLEDQFIASNLQSYTLTINESLYTQLVAFSKTQAITLNSILQYVWHKIIKSQVPDTKTISGVVVSGRTLPVDEITNAVGLFINTLPLIIDWKLIENEPLKQQLQYFQDKIVQISVNCTQSLSSLQKGTRLFDSIVAFENYPEMVKEESWKFDFKLIDIKEKFDYPLALIVIDHHSYLDITLKFDERLIPQSVVKHMALRINELLKNIKELSYVNHFDAPMLMPTLAIKQEEVTSFKNTCTTTESNAQTRQVEEEMTDNNVKILKEQIFNIWVSIFNTSDFSIDDDFFKIGGDSILAIRVCMRLMKLGLECNVKEIHKYTTINKLAGFLNKKKIGVSHG